MVLFTRRSRHRLKWLGSSSLAAVVNWIWFTAGWCEGACHRNQAQNWRFLIIFSGWSTIWLGHCLCLLPWNPWFIGGVRPQQTLTMAQHGVWQSLVRGFAHGGHLRSCLRRFVRIVTQKQDTVSTLASHAWLKFLQCVIKLFRCCSAEQVWREKAGIIFKRIPTWTLYDLDQTMIWRPVSTLHAPR